MQPPKGPNPRSQQFSRRSRSWHEVRSRKPGTYSKRPARSIPRVPEIWIAQISLMRSQGQVEKAQKLLDQAEGQLGDRVDLRLARAQLSANPKGPEVITALNKLAQNLDGFSKPDQYKLLNGLAIEHIRHEDLQSANRLWSELAQQLPNNIESAAQLAQARVSDGQRRRDQEGD